MAEREGFEPSIPFPGYTISSRALSTTQPPLRGDGEPNCNGLKTPDRDQKPHVSRFGPSATACMVWNPSIACISLFSIEFLRH